MMHLLALVGPTATGKTRMAVHIAHALGTEIVSADSRQVYRGLDIGTGKDLGEYQAVDPPVPVHLLDVADPRETYSLYHYQQDVYALLAAKANQRAFRQGLPLVMAGGTGLYVEAVLRGYRLADVPPDPELRATLEAQPLDQLLALLEDEDRELLRSTDNSTSRRVIRAIEIARARRTREIGFSGLPPCELRYRVYGVQLDRDRLRERIASRLQARLEEGMVPEVQRLLDEGVPPERLHRLGLEYREINAHLQGQKDLAQMTRDLGQAIYQLARRQQTYFRGMERRGIPISWVQAGDWEAVLSDHERGDRARWRTLPPL
jgi:tRNA dimethylallyltransferase